MNTIEEALTKAQTKDEEIQSQEVSFIPVKVSKFRELEARFAATEGKDDSARFLDAARVIQEQMVKVGNAPAENRSGALKKVIAACIALDPGLAARTDTTLPQENIKLQEVIEEKDKEIQTLQADVDALGIMLDEKEVEAAGLRANIEAKAASLAEDQLAPMRQQLADLHSQLAFARRTHPDQEVMVKRLLDAAKRNTGHPGFVRLYVKPNGTLSME